MSNRRPEHSCPPQQYYNENESQKYTKNSRIVKIQRELAERAYDLLELAEGEENHHLLLDIGCGSGLSGEILTENGHLWIGMDISADMLKVAKEENEAEGDLILGDIGCGLPFVPGAFDGAISISVLQWLCHSNSKKERPEYRLFTFFQSLYACLKRGARAVFQFYPESQTQSELICGQAIRAGFRGGLVVDYPEVKKKTKIFLVINAGGGSQIVPKAVGGGISDGDDENMEIEQQIANSSRTTRQIIEAKKERQRRRGKDVKDSTKYTGRKRRH